MEAQYRRIKEIVEKELSCLAHSMDHVMRVHANCLMLADEEGVDLDVLKTAALMHAISYSVLDKTILSKQIYPYTRDFKFGFLTSIV